jgi:hypothetical protein
VLFNKIRSALLKFPEAKGGHYMIPATVTRLGNQAFNSVSGLTRLTFLGDAPELGADVFTGSNALTSIIYNSSKSGWSSTFGGLTAHAAPLPSVLSHAVISGEHGAGFNLTFTSVEGFSYNVQAYTTGWSRTEPAHTAALPRTRSMMAAGSTPFSPPSGPIQWLFHGPRAENK